MPPPATADSRPPCHLPAAAPFWAHLVSEDMAHWRWLPPALLPDAPYDFSGVWSGSATVPEETGVPVLLYTGESCGVCCDRGAAAALQVHCCWCMRG